LYRRAGNPDFDPTTGAGDGGVDMQTMCEALMAGGIAGTKALAFAAVDVANLEEMRSAIAIFGSLLYGVDLQVEQQQQRVIWDHTASGDHGEWGGHAVLGGSYTSTGPSDVVVVSWADPIGMSKVFEENQVKEAWVVIWPEHLLSVPFLQGVDLTSLASDYQVLTGKTFPATIPALPALPRLRRLENELGKV
jgi:hypothetical protein